ncbi:hypothetical protein Taro_033436, partial [Colocasia esculenta]|nr:hypothetical protein [Colocasia esculenta]
FSALFRTVNGRHRGGGKGDRVDGRLVGVEQPPVVLDPRRLLLVLVEHGEDVRLHRLPGLPGRPLPDMGHQVRVVDPGVLHGGREPTGRRPASLRHDDVDAAGPHPVQRRIHGVHHGVEQVLVFEAVVAIHHDDVRRGELGIVEVDVLGVARVAEVGVDVHQEGRPRAAQELHDGPHHRPHLGAELADGRRVGLSHDSVLHRRRHLDLVSQAGGGEGLVDVAHGREDVLGHPFVEDDLVADGDVAEADVGPVGENVVADPVGGGGGALGKVPKGAGEVEEEIDVGAAEGLEDLLAGVVDPHPADVVGSVHADNLPGRRQVVAQPAIADTHRLRTWLICRRQIMRQRDGEGGCFTPVGVIAISGPASRSRVATRGSCPVEAMDRRRVRPLLSNALPPYVNSHQRPPQVALRT